MSLSSLTRNHQALKPNVIQDLNVCPKTGQEKCKAIITIITAIFRCSFLGEVVEEETKYSRLFDILRVPLNSCRTGRMDANKAIIGVCCKMFQQTDKSHLMRQQQEVEANEDEYYYDYYEESYDTGDNAEYEDFDMIFDKVVIFSHENAAKGG